MVSSLLLFCQGCTVPSLIQFTNEKCLVRRGRATARSAVVRPSRTSDNSNLLWGYFQWIITIRDRSRRRGRSLVVLFIATLKVSNCFSSSFFEMRNLNNISCAIIMLKLPFTHHVHLNRTKKFPCIFHGHISHQNKDVLSNNFKFIHSIQVNSIIHSKNNTCPISLEEDSASTYLRLLV